MKCKYSITFEFDTAKPITEKGFSEGTSVRTVAARALDDAVDKNKNVNWSSLVLVLERESNSNDKEVQTKEEQDLT